MHQVVKYIGLASTLPIKYDDLAHLQLPPH